MGLLEDLGVFLLFGGLAVAVIIGGSRYSATRRQQLPASFWLDSWQGLDKHQLAAAREQALRNARASGATYGRDVAIGLSMSLAGVLVLIVWAAVR